MTGWKIIVPALFVVAGLSLTLFAQETVLAGALGRHATQQGSGQELLYQDTFDDPSAETAGDWAANEGVLRDVGYKDDALVIRGRRQEELTWSQLQQPFGDATVAVDAWVAGGDGDDGYAYGVACRVQSTPEEGGYGFFLRGDGAYAIVKDIGAQPIPAATWSSSDAILTGGSPNRVAATCSGDTMTLRVNGQELATLEDEAFADGKIALLAVRYGSAPVEVRFDNLEVTAATVEAPAVQEVLLPTPTPGVTLLDNPAVEPAQTGVSISHDLQGYESYALRLATVYTPEAESGILPARAISIELTYNSQPREQSFVVKAEGVENPEEIEMSLVQIGDQVYASQPSRGCVSVPLSDQPGFGPEPYYVQFRLPTPDLSGPLELTPLGEGLVTVNGVEAQPYAVAEASFYDMLGYTPDQVSDLRGAVYVDSESGALVRMVVQGSGRTGLEAAGEDPDLTGAFVVTMDVSGINEPIQLPIPDACAELVEGAESGPETAEQEAEILYADDLNDGADAWIPEENDALSTGLSNGAYVMEVAPGGIAWSLASEHVFGDFTAGVTAELAEGPDHTGYGLVFRHDEFEGYYTLLIDGQGRFRVGQVWLDEWWSVRNGWWQHSPAIKTGGEPNRLEVTVVGSDIAVSVNGEHLATLTGVYREEGRIGVGVLNESRRPAQVTFDDFVVAVPQSYPPVVKSDEPDLFFRDDFEIPASGWPISARPDLEQGYRDGEYIAQANSPSIRFISRPRGSSGLKYTSLTVDADMRVPDGSQDSAYGLSARFRDAKNRFEFWVNGRGEYRIVKRVEGKMLSTGFDEWTESQHVLTDGATNRLRVSANGDLLAFYANGHHLATVADGMLRWGEVGIAVGAGKDELPLTVAVDNFIVTAVQRDEFTQALLPRANGALLWEDQFTGQTAARPMFGEDWMTYKETKGAGVVTSGKAGLVLPIMYSQQLVAAHYYEFDFRDASPERSNSYGAYFSFDGYSGSPDSFYTLAMSPAENRITYRSISNGEEVESRGIDLDETLLLPGGFNRVRAEVLQGPIVVFVNGRFAMLVTDEMLTKPGYLGILLATGDDVAEGASGQAQFRDLRVFAPVVTKSGAGQADAGNGESETGEEEQDTSAKAPDELSAASAVVRSTGLNIRKGPGTNYAIVTTARSGDRLEAIGRNANCSWLKVQLRGNEGWVSSSYVTLNGDCDDLPAEAAPPATSAASVAVQTPAAQTSATTSAGGSSLVTGFENFGVWRRGDEPWGTFTQSGEQAKSSNYSGKLAYDFDADKAADKNYVVFMRTIPIAGEPDRLTIQVYGDGSGSFLNPWVRDASGQLWQFSFGPINHKGWKAMTARLNPDQDWPVQPIGGDATELTYPIGFYALVLDYPDDEDATGEIYVDNLRAVSPKE